MTNPTTHPGHDDPATHPLAPLPGEHCFREDGCAAHVAAGAVPETACCCCGQAPEVHTGCDCEPTAPRLDLDVLQRCLGVGPAENEREDYLARAAGDLVAEVRRLRSALVTLDEQFLARRDAIDSNDSRGTPGRRARMAWEDAARAVRAVAS